MKKNCEFLKICKKFFNKLQENPVDVCKNVFHKLQENFQKLQVFKNMQKKFY